MCVDLEQALQEVCDLGSKVPEGGGEGDQGQSVVGVSRTGSITGLLTTG